MVLLDTAETGRHMICALKPDVLNVAYYSARPASLASW